MSNRRPQLVRTASLLAGVLLCILFAEPVAHAATGASRQAHMRRASMRVRMSSSTALTVASAEDDAGGAVTVVATVAGPAGSTPQGSVVFLLGGKRMGEVPVANGAATMTLPQLPAGSSSLSAAYRGNDNFLPSRSTTVRFYRDEQN